MGDRKNPSQSVNDPTSSVGADLEVDETTKGPPTTNNAPQKNSRKRTKTGCLTCRQRRIKCGEEKPICANCIKSKRDCKGYGQRVIFKNPIGLHGVYNPQQLLNAQIQPMPTVVPFVNGYENRPLPPQVPQQRPAGSRHPILAPKPSGFSAVGQSSLSATGAPSQLGPQGVNPTSYYYQPFQAPVPLPSAFEQELGNRPLASTAEGASGRQDNGSQLTSDPNNTHRDLGTAPSLPTQNRLNAREAPSVAADIVQDASRPSFSGPGTQASASWNQNAASLHYRPIQEQQQFHTNAPFLSPTSSLQFMYDEESDDYYDVESDEEMAVQTQAEDANQLSLIMASAYQDDQRLRSFTTHLNEPNILASYRPTLGSSPLNNPKTARIFIHFIHSTGPSLSIFERHPYDSSLVFGGLVPEAQQGLWTYTLPLKALEHPALLQAILAISSLHISFLQDAPPTVSLKHYHYALKRIATAVGLPNRRKQIGTLAATLLLGYYEVMAAEHSKWNSHVAGSAQLVREVDFAGIARDLRAHRRRVLAQQDYMTRSGSLFADYHSWNRVSEDDPFAAKELTIDENLIGSITGRAINYDEFGKVDDGQPQPSYKHFSKKDIENFRIQSDLYWWYCKQDIIQGMISGNRLFMPYFQWGQCPPRAGVGRLDAVYGSTDHVWLLLGRIADFGYRDRKRKLKAARNTGSEWKPTPALFKFMGRFAGGGRGPPPGPPPGAPKPPGTSQSQGNAPRPGGGPPMYGMVPSRGPVRLPSSFANAGPRATVVEDEDEGEDMTFSEAENEWESILAACDTFAQALGRDFQPLPSDITPPISTPFGPALQYRTNTVAVLWGFYFAGRILLNRLHPSMPPAMMVAAGVAAPATAEYAQIIGKIAAGIYYPQRFNLEAGSLSPTLGSSLTEMTVPIFFAAVQYTDPAQRGWTIAKLRDVSRLTGWKTSNAIASGCENSWVVAAKQGRGPPYSRTSENDRGRGHLYTDVSQQGGAVNHERRFVAVSKSDRLHWAMGILSLEDDLLNLEIDDRV